MAVMQPDEVNTEASGGETVEELFAALESPLLNYACRLVGGLCVAADMVQEAFMKLHAHFEQVREPRRWRYRTVHNKALNHRRQVDEVIPLTQRADEAAGAAADEPNPRPQ